MHDIPLHSGAFHVNGNQAGRECEMCLLLDAGWHPQLRAGAEPLLSPSARTADHMGNSEMPVNPPEGLRAAEVGVNIRLRSGEMKKKKWIDVEKKKKHHKCFSAKARNYSIRSKTRVFFFWKKC